MDLFPSRDQLIDELRAENKRMREDPSYRVYCVVCDQHCKRYTRNLYATPCLILIALFKLHRAHPEEKDFHVKNIWRVAGLGPGGGGRELLGYYNFAHRGERGCWSITSAGKEFVNRKRSVPKYVIVYNEKVIGYSGEEHPFVNIEDALGEKFNYGELMSR